MIVFTRRTYPTTLSLVTAQFLSGAAKKNPLASMPAKQSG
jgi:hypothetical protein